MLSWLETFTPSFDIFWNVWVGGTFTCEEKDDNKSGIGDTATRNNRRRRH